MPSSLRTLLGAASSALLCTLAVASPAHAQRIALGVTIADAPDQPARIDDYARLAGRQPAIVMWYQSFGEPLAYNGELTAVAARGAVPMVTWEPAIGNRGVPMRALADGRWDGYLDQAAHLAAAFGRPFYVRFAHEMNLRSSAWSVGHDGNTPADLIAAWRHVVGVFRRDGATNVRWVWSPNLDCNGGCPFTQLYPGDRWVDYVALDGYNFGPVDRTAWQSFNRLFAGSYHALTTLTSKPVIVAETASTERGGNKAAWIRQAFLKKIPRHLPRVRAVIWFDHSKETDWRVNSSAASLAAWREVVSSPLYAGSAPLADTSSPDAAAAPVPLAGEFSLATLAHVRCRGRHRRSRLCTVSGRLARAAACRGLIRVTLLGRRRRRLAARTLPLRGCRFHGRIRLRTRARPVGVSASSAGR